MKKIIVLLLVTFSLTTNLVANNDPGNITLLSGKIIDKQTGEALTGVKIQIKGTDKYCYSDMNGCFAITLIGSNNTEVAIEMVGYEPTTLKSKELSLSSDIVLNPR